MSWEMVKFWARPFHNVIALFDGQLIETTVAHLQTSQQSVGHRLFATPFTVTSSQDWQQKLYNNKVIVDKEERRRSIETQLNEMSEGLDSTVLAMDLIDEVVDLVEWPVTIRTFR